MEAVTYPYVRIDYYFEEVDHHVVVPWRSAEATKMYLIEQGNSVINGKGLTEQEYLEYQLGNVSMLKVEYHHVAYGGEDADLSQSRETEYVAEDELHSFLEGLAEKGHSLIRHEEAGWTRSSHESVMEKLLVQA